MSVGQIEGRDRAGLLSAAVKFRVRITGCGENVYDGTPIVEESKALIGRIYPPRVLTVVNIISCPIYCKRILFNRPESSNANISME